jgi:hypothetical protein
VCERARDCVRERERERECVCVSVCQCDRSRTALWSIVQMLSSKSHWLFPITLTHPLIGFFTMHTWRACVGSSKLPLRERDSTDGRDGDVCV